MTNDIENKLAKANNKKIGKNGIITIIYNGEKFTFWYDAEIVYEHIFKFLSQKFPDPTDLICRELNRIDIAVLTKNEKIPIEVQSSHIVWGKNPTVSLSRFENDIRKQIEENITNNRGNYLWFFFDAELYRFMSSREKLHHNTAVNLTWLRKFIKDGLLKTFVVKYSGEIKELSYEDFNFLSKISTCCPIGEETDERILNKNKLELIYRILNGYNFSKEEYHSYQLSSQRDGLNCANFIRYLHRKGSNDREHLLGNILKSVDNLRIINDGLDCNHPPDRTIPETKWFLKNVGVIENDKIIDKFHVLWLFPGYSRNKEKWDYLLESNMRLTNRQFGAIITGNVNPLDWKKLINCGF